jgi:probable HAF family extracellular repeat protein
MTDLGALPGHTYSAAAGINDGGVVVGESWSVNPDWTTASRRACVWSTDGSVVDLGRGGARAVNSAGQVVGQADGRAFRWTAGIGKEDLGALPGGSRSAAYAINNAGVVVGTAWVGAEYVSQRAIVYTNGSGLVDLNSLLAPTAQGWGLAEARGINNVGDVVGWGYRNGERRAFALKTPCY